jgi:hypothetical protein
MTATRAVERTCRMEKLPLSRRSVHQRNVVRCSATVPRAMLVLRVKADDPSGVAKRSLVLRLCV